MKWNKHRELLVSYECYPSEEVDGGWILESNGWSMDENLAVVDELELILGITISQVKSIQDEKQFWFKFSQVVGQ